MRGLLGLADRGRIFDLFDMLMRGEVTAALDEFEAQYAMGADPATILADLAELTHWLTRMKFVAAAQEDVAFSAQLRSRGQEAAEHLSTRILSRVWQLLLAGHDEVNRAMNAKAAAEMVLIRLAHISDMPTPEELIKQYETAQPGPSAAGAAPSAPQGSGGQANGGAPQGGGASAMGVSQGAAQTPSGGASMRGPSGHMPQAAPVVQSTAPVLQNFQAIIDLVADQRDIGLKHALENGVHLVSFEAAAGERAGRIEFRLADGHDNIAQDLTRKLRDWTGQNWVISLSKEQGQETLGALKRTIAERREDEARADPFVKAALAAFPEAEIISVAAFGDDALPAAPDEADEAFGEGDAQDTRSQDSGNDS
jgi:DNA polymerase-3 subunit gamma/tau